MKRLELFHPVKPWSVYNAFGNPLKLYTDMGMKGHNGFDVLAPHGTPVRAAHDGIVTQAGDDGSAGIGVVVRTEDEREYGTTSTFFKTIYWHLAPATCHNGKHQIAVKPGDQVLVGDILGYADNTGLSSGDHLHFGLKPVYPGEQDWQWFNSEQQNGYFGAIDPTPYISRYAAEDYAGWRRTLRYLSDLAAKLLKPKSPAPPPDLVSALIQTESNGNDWAVGDTHLVNKAYGPLQIRKPCLDDVNTVNGTNYRPEEMRGNRKLSIWVFEQYMKIWATEEKIGRPVTNQDRARIWNGGPRGWMKPQTLSYWSKVLKVAPNLRNT